MTRLRKEHMSIEVIVIIVLLIGAALVSDTLRHIK